MPFVNPVGWVSTHLKLIPTKVVLGDVLSPLPSRERVRVRGNVERSGYVEPNPFALSPSKGLLNEITRLRRSRSMAARGQSLFAVAQKVTKNACPCTPLHPAVLATRGMRQRHTKASLTLRTVCADDASTTARCSAPRRGLKGPFEPMFDRFAMGTTRTRMQASGLR